MSKKRLNAYLLLLLVSIIWGAATPVVKFALTWFHPTLFLTYRFAISSVIALFLYRMYPVKIPKKQSDRSLAFITALLSTPISIGLFFLALTKTSALSGSLITAGEPILIIAVGVLFLKEYISDTEKLGIIVTVFGTFIAVVAPLIFNHTANHIGSFEGNSIMAAATLADLVAAILTKIALGRGVSPHLLAHAQFILGFCIYLPVLLILYPVRDTIRLIVTAPWQAHASVLFMALFSGTLAYTLRNIAVQWIEISEAALFYYLQPVWSAILAVVWLGESITISYILGAAIIAAGVMIAEYRRRSRPAYAVRPATVTRRISRRRKR